MGNEIDGKLASKNMSIIADTKQTRVQIPEFLIEVFDIDPEKDKFNWYVKRKGGRLRLMAILNKGGRLKDFWIGKDKEEYFEKEIQKEKENGS